MGNTKHIQFSGEAKAADVLDADELCRQTHASYGAVRTFEGGYYGQGREGDVFVLGSLESTSLIDPCAALVKMLRWGHIIRLDLDEGMVNVIIVDGHEVVGGVENGSVVWKDPQPWQDLQLKLLAQRARAEENRGELMALAYPGWELLLPKGGIPQLWRDQFKGGNRAFSLYGDDRRAWAALELLPHGMRITSVLNPDGYTLQWLTWRENFESLGRTSILLQRLAQAIPYLAGLAGKGPKHRWM